MVETDVGDLRDLTSAEAVHATSTLASNTDLLGRKAIALLYEQPAHQLTCTRPIHAAAFSLT
ncbi:hypothetical protein R4P64_03870 [Rhodococcus sp. IEGM 1366]|uniref:hypothetical protein n=1 Tax=Rhodococcus sp. IEGM 1366 TaxID=3082223 RepID=UPI002955AC30|nr:hypothetical protein [Rhodococcus sp. IEGM 1366]MDV8065633.1 hypothetical protein [Rhodococcus sp. IEGM 1366]